MNDDEAGDLGREEKREAVEEAGEDRLDQSGRDRHAAHQRQAAEPGGRRGGEEVRARRDSGRGSPSRCWQAQGLEIVPSPQAIMVSATTACTWSKAAAELGDQDDGEDERARNQQDVLHREESRADRQGGRSSTP